MFSCTVIDNYYSDQAIKVKFPDRVNESCQNIAIIVIDSDKNAFHPIR